MDEKQNAALRAPFPPELISLLPKVNCKACSDNKSQKHCDRHQMAKCQGCGAWITTQHIHLSYVGHAETTDRFLDVDPEWTWEPVAFGPDGLPRLDGHGGLWMRLTIGGVTRLCYGDSQGKQGPNAVKEAIGDGLRNGGMRFGVALDLWAKSDLASIHADKETGEIAPTPPAPPEPPPQQSNGNGNGHAPNGGSRAPGLSPEMLAVRTRVSTAGKALGFTVPQINEDFARENGGLTIPSASVEQLTGYAEDLESRVTAGASS